MKHQQIITLTALYGFGLTLTLWALADQKIDGRYLLGMIIITALTLKVLTQVTKQRGTR